MLQDGILKVLKGVTSLDEVFRAVGKFEYIDSLYDIVISQTFKSNGVFAMDGESTDSGN